MDRLAFSTCLALRPYRYVLKSLPSRQTKWRCAMSSSAPRGRGIWDLDQPSDNSGRSGNRNNRSNYRSRNDYNEGGRSSRSVRQTSYDERSAPRPYSGRDRNWGSTSRQDRNEQGGRRNERTHDNSNWANDSDSGSESYGTRSGYNDRRSSRSAGDERRQSRSFRDDRRPSRSAGDDRRPSRSAGDERRPSRSYGDRQGSYNRGSPNQRYERDDRRNNKRPYNSATSFDEGSSDKEEYGRRDSFNPPRHNNRTNGRFSDSQQSWRDKPRDRDYRDVEVSPERILIREALDSETEDLVYGISPVLLALKTSVRDRFLRLFIQQRASDIEDNGNESAGPSRKVENAEALELIKTLASSFEIPVSKVSKGDLNLLSNYRPHQGIVLQAGKRDFQELKQLPTVEKNTKSEDGKIPCYLVLDEITDPQNAGSLLRSAHFLGAQGVIMCKRNSCSLSAVVSKASAGALEVMTVYGISSMPKFLRASRDSGWRVIGMACGEGAISSKQLSLDQPTLIVLGNEGRGMRTLVKQACDVVVEIEGLGGQHDDIDSLNVSVAGAVALYQLLGR